MAVGERKTTGSASAFARALLVCAVLFAAPVCAAEPAPGTVVAKANLARYEALLGPALRWAVGRGLEMEVVAPRSIPLEPARLAATEKYSAQVRLSEDKLRVENFIAGLPFPLVRDEDPDVAVKLMFNYENRIIVDDLDVRNFDCDTGAISANAPMRSLST